MKCTYELTESSHWDAYKDVGARPYSLLESQQRGSAELLAVRVNINDHGQSKSAACITVTTNSARPPSLQGQGLENTLQCTESSHMHVNRRCKPSPDARHPIEDQTCPF